MPRSATLTSPQRRLLRALHDGSAEHGVIEQRVRKALTDGADPHFFEPGSWAKRPVPAIALAVHGLRTGAARLLWPHVRQRLSPLQRHRLLGLAIQSGQVPLARLFAAEGAGVHPPKETEPTLMHRAVEASWCASETIPWLKQLGVPLNDSGCGSPPLHLALRMDASKQSARALIAAGADPLARDADGGTALHALALSPPAPERFPFWQLLLEAGADPERINRRRETPLEILRTAAPGLPDAARRFIEQEMAFLVSYSLSRSLPSATASGVRARL